MSMKAYIVLPYIAGVTEVTWIPPVELSQWSKAKICGRAGQLPSGNLQVCMNVKQDVADGLCSLSLP